MLFINTVICSQLLQQRHYINWNWLEMRDNIGMSADGSVEPSNREYEEYTLRMSTDLGTWNKPTLNVITLDSNELFSIVPALNL